MLHVALQCGHISARMACRDGCLKIFQKPLDAKKVLKNRSKGIDITSALTVSRNSEVRRSTCLSCHLTFCVLLVCHGMFKFCAGACRERCSLCTLRGSWNL